MLKACKPLVYPILQATERPPAKSHPTPKPTSRLPFSKADHPRKASTSTLSLMLMLSSTSKRFEIAKAVVWSCMSKAVEAKPRREFRRTCFDSSSSSKPLLLSAARACTSWQGQAQALATSSLQCRYKGCNLSELQTLPNFLAYPLTGLFTSKSADHSREILTYFCVTFLRGKIPMHDLLSPQREHTGKTGLRYSVLCLL